MGLGHPAGWSVRSGAGLQIAHFCAGVPKHVRMMDVMYESLEDLYLLGHCTRIATTSSSHFSTFATLLLWARSGTAAVPATAFLDAAGIAEGGIQSAFLHGAVNGTTRPVPGARRWRALSTRFVESAWNDAAEAALLEPAAATAMLHNEEGIPTLPSDVFWAEVLRWSSLVSRVGGWGIRWPLNRLLCPSRPLLGTSARVAGRVPSTAATWILRRRVCRIPHQCWGRTHNADASALRPGGSLLECSAGTCQSCCQRQWRWQHYRRDAGDIP